MFIPPRKKGSTLKPSSWKLGTCQGQNPSTLACQTPFQNHCPLNVWPSHEVYVYVRIVFKVFPIIGVATKMKVKRNQQWVLNRLRLRCTNRATKYNYVSWSLFVVISKKKIAQSTTHWLKRPQRFVAQSHDLSEFGRFQQVVSLSVKKEEK